MKLIDRVLAARNLTEACKEVVRNKGAGGVDGMSVKTLKSYLDEHRQELIEQIHHGNYQPKPVRGKELRRSRSHDQRE
jgi:retron-type reverse transcriptase